MIITVPRAAKFVFAMAVLGAMLVSPITAQKSNQPGEGRTGANAE